MIIGSTLRHSKFGEGTVSNINGDKIEITFSSGDAKVFPVDAVIKFFSNISEELKELSNKSAKEKEEIAEENRARMSERIENALKEKYIKYEKAYEMDEFDREVTLEDWKRAYDVAEEYRFFHQQRAVVMDTGVMFINASAALRFLNHNPKSGDKVYEVCERAKKKYLGHSWRYATKEDIQKYIDYIEEEEK